jgi:hypothetical protein
MNARLNSVFRFLLLSLVAQLSPIAWAQAAVGYTSLNNSFLDSTTRMIGWRFSVTESVNVTALGWFDLGGNGLNRAHEIGIWNTADQSLVVTGTVPLGTAATLTNGFRYITLGTSGTLLTGQNYVIAGLDIGSLGDAHVWDANIGFGNPDVNGFSADPRITLQVGNAVGQAGVGGFQYPSAVIGDARKLLMGPNFVISAIPEPSTYAALAGVAALGLAIWRRRSRTR